MYQKGEWKDRRRHSVTIPKLDRLMHHVTHKLDDKGRRATPPSKVTVTYHVGVVANDVYRMVIGENRKGRPIFGHKLWHRGARVGQI